MTRILYSFVLALFLTLPAGIAGSQPAQSGAALSGDGIAAVHLTPESLAALPLTQIDVTYETSKGPRAERYEGVPLWIVLSQDGHLADHKAALARSVIVTGRDGHRVAFSLGEILPDFGNQPVLIAWTVDGQPTPDGLRMVVPGDGRGGRYVKDVVTIELR